MTRTKVRKVFVTIGIASIFGILSVASLSYLQSRSTVTDRHTVGQNDTEIIESYTKPSSLTNGQSVKKVVQVRNNGTVPTYVRVFAQPTANPGNTIRLETSSLVDNNISVSTGKDWYTSGTSGDYFYYKKVLQPGETTTPLMNSITVVNTSYGADLNETLTPENLQVLVYEESQQSEGFSNPLNAFK